MDFGLVRDWTGTRYDEPPIYISARCWREIIIFAIFSSSEPLSRPGDAKFSVSSQRRNVL